MPDFLFIPLMTLVFMLVMAGVWRPFMGAFENPTFKVKRFYVTLALFLATSAFIMGFLTHNRPQSFIFLIALILILVLSFISTKIQTASPHQQLIISVVALIGIGVNLLIFAGITTDEATKNYRIARKIHPL